MNTMLIEPESVGSPSRSHTAPARQPQAGEPRMRILYVDEDPLVRKLGKLVLTRSGYDVDGAVDGMEAWDALHDVNYSLLITEQEMHRLTGLELVAQARLAGMRLPIVLATSSMDALDDPSTVWLDLAAHLPKPFGIDTLVDTVEQALHRVRPPRRHGPATSSLLARLAQIQPYSCCGINE